MASAKGFQTLNLLFYWKGTNGRKMSVKTTKTITDIITIYESY